METIDSRIGSGQRRDIPEFFIIQKWEYIEWIDVAPNKRAIDRKNPI